MPSPPTDGIGYTNRLKGCCMRWVAWDNNGDDDDDDDDGGGGEGDDVYPLDEE